MIYSPVFSDKRKVPQWLTKQPIAHRGMHQMPEAPENSMAAFQHALDHGFAIELDVQLTANGRVIVFHDETLRRMCATPGLVREKTYRELSRLKLAGTKEGIPLLKKVLELVDGKVPIFIELKTTPYNAGLLADAVRKLIKNYSGPLAILSFDPSVLSWFRKNAPEIIRGQTSYKYTDQDALQNLSWDERFLRRYFLYNWQGEPDFLIYSLKDLPNPTLSYERFCKVPVIVWGVDDTALVSQAQKQADAFMFDHIGKSL